MEIVKSDSYLVGICSITQWVGKERKLMFDSGLPIEVSEEEFNIIKSHGWCNIYHEKELKDGE